MRCVIDTNVLISYFLFPHSTPGQAIIKALQGKLLFSEPTFGELIAVLYRPKFDRYTNPTFRRDFIHKITSVMNIIPIPHPIRACRDPNDDKFLDAAVHGDADYLITGDSDLLILHPFMEVAIVTPSQFLTMA